MVEELLQAAIVAQGGAQGTTGSQTFDGTAWATSAALATNKSSRAGGGTTQTTFICSWWWSSSCCFNSNRRI